MLIFIIIIYIILLLIIFYIFNKIKFNPNYHTSHFFKLSYESTLLKKVLFARIIPTMKSIFKYQKLFQHLVAFAHDIYLTIMIYCPFTKVIWYWNY